MQICADQGWVRAGLAVLVAGVLGGGVLVAAGGGAGEPRQVKADGVAGASPASAVEAEALRPPESAKADPVVVGDKVEMGDDGGSVTVLAVEDNVSAGRLFGAGAGQKYVAAEVKGCSGPNEKNITFEPVYFLLRLDDGTIRDTGAGAKKPSLEGGTIPAGKCLSGWVTFTVPDGAVPTAVIYDGSSRTTWALPPPKDAKQTTTTTMKAGATTTTGDPDTTSTTRAKTSTTTTTKARSTATTARSTATTARSTATTARSGSSTAGTTAKSGSTTTTAKSGGGTTSTTAKPAASGSTTTTGKAGNTTPTTSSASTTTTAANRSTTSTTADKG